MKNLKISILCSTFIAFAMHSSQEHTSRPHPSTFPMRTPFKLPQRPPLNFDSNITEILNSQNKQKKSNPEMPFLDKLETARIIVSMAKDIYSLLPGEENKQSIEKNKKDLEQYNAELAQQQEINTARRSFYKCCQNNQGLEVERITNGLPKTCQDVAMNYAAFGYRNDVEEAIEFFNKFRN